MKDTRHRCKAGRKWYDAGHAVIFWDAGYQDWVMAMPSSEDWNATAEEDLAGLCRSREAEDYETWVYVDYCPWCGGRLEGEG
jgi:hypothetical protein